MSRVFLTNSDYVAYARLHFRLHGLIATDAAESPEAEELRAGMDDAWARLGGPERDDLRKLSAELYAFHAGETAGAA